jgi:hypothetical protein
MSIDSQLSQLFCHASNNLPQALALLSIGTVSVPYGGIIRYNWQGIVSGILFIGTPYASHA